MPMTIGKHTRGTAGSALLLTIGPEVLKVTHERVSGKGTVVLVWDILHAFFLLQTSSINE